MNRRTIFPIPIAAALALALMELGCRGKRSPNDSTKAPLSVGGSEASPETGSEIAVADFASRPVSPSRGSVPDFVQHALFPAGVKRDGPCDLPAGDLAAARARGSVDPKVLSERSGSFSASGALEAAYLVHVGECNATHAESFGSRRLVITQGTSVIKDLEVPFDNIEGAFDFDHDGLTELLVSASGIGQGVAVTHAWFVDFAGGQLRRRESFDEVVFDSCASRLAGSELRTARIVARPSKPGARPNFHVDYTQSPCPP